jgi:cytoskeletal protein CcmA (bactofilin family)
MTSAVTQRDVECPHCRHRQSEAVDVLVTICRDCRESFAVPPAPARDGHPPSLRALARTLTGHAREGWSEFGRRWHAQPTSPRLRHGPWLAAAPLPTSEDAGGCSSPASPAGFKEVLCPYCHATAWLPSTALTGCCSACSRHFSLQNHEIRGLIHTNLVTAGTLVIHYGAQLVSSWIRCGELFAYGQTTGSLTIGGRACYHGHGETVGEVHCGHLIVARGARRVFHQRIFAMAADIDGELHGDLCCAGRLRVPRGAMIDGDVLAGQVVLEAGGRINGSVGTLPAVLRPGAPLAATARALLHNFAQNEGDR